MESRLLDSPRSALCQSIEVECLAENFKITFVSVCRGGKSITQWITTKPTLCQSIEVGSLAENFEITSVSVYRGGKSGGELRNHLCVSLPRWKVWRRTTKSPLCQSIEVESLVENFEIISVSVYRGGKSTTQWITTKPTLCQSTEVESLGGELRNHLCVSLLRWKVCWRTSKSSLCQSIEVERRLPKNNKVSMERAGGWGGML